MQIHKIIFCINILLLFFITTATNAKEQKEKEYLEGIPRSGDNISTFLHRYKLPSDKNTVSEFKELNLKSILKNDGLAAGVKYRIPVRIYEFNGKSIRSSLGIDEYELAKKIESYNKRLFSAGIIKEKYRKSKQIYVPIDFYVPETEADGDENNHQEIKKETIKPKKILKKETKKSLQKDKDRNYSIFGRKYQKVKLIDSALQNQVYYLISGHGGPDPGAVGIKNRHELCEDEYAYDIVLRLGRALLEHDATVYFICQAPDDGIRDEKYLSNDGHEKYLGGEVISASQVDRLAKKAEIVNKLYEQNKNKAQQLLLELHVDSRYEGKRIDIFFYHNPGSDEGEQIAKTLLKTIEDKYKMNQPGRGYTGNVTPRNLYMLRGTLPTAVYIELGNIKNEKDQQRLIEKNNRQAIANWLCAGLLRQAKKK
ncbi:MAG: N-acetylmuramoyl-L-alanine amidase [Ignavibacteria bacterium]|nr:N-acetylmuramoyl-L-alanine amidase [Ignavibacteria bacterium]